jgi:hypothetical protein
VTETNVRLIKSEEGCPAHARHPSLVTRKLSERY